MPRNISVPTFTYAPRSYEELKKEGDEFLARYYATEGAMSQLEQNIGDYQSVMDTFKGKNVDGLDAVKEYMDYMQQVNDLSHKLAVNGASPEVKRTLMKMQSRYNAVFDPIKEAEAANKKWRDIAQTLDPNDMYDPGQLTYEYMLGKNRDTGEYNYNGTFRHIDANTARKEVETVAKELADQIFTNGNNLPLQQLNNAGVQSLLRYGVDANDYNKVLEAISEGKNRTSNGLNDRQKLLYGIVENIVGQKDLDSYGLSQDQKDRFWNIAAEGLYSAIGKPSLYTPPEPKVEGNGNGNGSGSGKGEEKNDGNDYKPYKSPYLDWPQTITDHTKQSEYEQQMVDYVLNENGERKDNYDNFSKDNNLFIHKIKTKFLGADKLAKDRVEGVRYYNSRDNIPDEYIRLSKQGNEDVVVEPDPNSTTGGWRVILTGMPLIELFNQTTGNGNTKTSISFRRTPSSTGEKENIFDAINLPGSSSYFVKYDGNTGRWEKTSYKRKETINEDKTFESKNITGMAYTPQGVVVHFKNGDEEADVLYDDNGNQDLKIMASYVSMQNTFQQFKDQLNRYLNIKSNDNLDLSKLQAIGIDEEDNLGIIIWFDGEPRSVKYKDLIRIYPTLKEMKSNGNDDMVEFIGKQLESMLDNVLNNIIKQRDIAANNIFRNINVQDVLSKEEPYKQ